MRGGRWTDEERRKWMDEHVDDETLIAFATTCSSAAIRLSAEMDLRRRYPSRKAERLIKQSQSSTEKKISPAYRSRANFCLMIREKRLQQMRRLGDMKFTAILILALSALAVHAQVPSSATPITIRQVNTLAGITTWTFNDAAGDTYYIQSPAYLVAHIPNGASATLPLYAPGLWVVPATATPPTSTASPDLTAITNNNGTITDATGGKWTVVNGVVQLNGSPIGYSSGVVNLVTVKGVLWQQNNAGGWWYWNATDKTWDGGAAPI